MSESDYIETTSGLFLSREAAQQAGVVRIEESDVSMLELALEDLGWRRMSASASTEFSKNGIDRIAELARLMAIKNPLIKRGLAVQANYVFGQGVQIQAKQDDINQVVQAFLDDPANRVFSGQQARIENDRLLAADGNLFFALFTNPVTGRVRVRTLPLYEVTEIVTNPEDKSEVWFYRRNYTTMDLNTASGAQASQSHTAYYPDWRYAPPAGQRPETIGGASVLWDAPVYHVKVGGFSDWRFGVSEVYAAIDWARAYKEFLEDWATLSRAYSRFAHKLTTPGGKAVAAAKTKLGTTLGAAAAPRGETNPPPVAGSTFIAGNGYDLSPIKVGGANVSADDGRRLLLMVAAAVGLPESFFGDVSVGNLATARSLDRPTQLAMAARQELWASIFKDICGYVVMQAVKAPRGALRSMGLVVVDDGYERVVWRIDPATGKPYNATIQSIWPPIVEINLSERSEAISKAVPSLPDQKLVAQLFLQALGVPDIDEVLAAMFDDNPATDAATVADAAVAEAVEALREVLQPLVERYAPAA